MRLSNGFVIDKEKTFGELKFTAVRDVFLQNEDGTPSTQLKKRIYDLKCSLHGGIIPVSVPPEVPLREFPYNAVVELVNPVADTVSRKTYIHLEHKSFVSTFGFVWSAPDHDQITVCVHQCGLVDCLISQLIHAKLAAVPEAGGADLLHGCDVFAQELMLQCVVGG